MNIDFSFVSPLGTGGDVFNDADAEDAVSNGVRGERASDTIDARLVATGGG